MKRLKNQKGAISVFVILAMLFFLAFMIGTYTITARRNAAQLDAARETTKIYQMSVDPNTAYDSLLSITDGSVVPISTIEQLKTLKGITEKGDPEVNYTINGKLYTYKKYVKPTEETKKPNITYILNNDIILDMKTEIDGHKTNVELYDYMLYDKEHYNINLNNHNIYYRLAKADDTDIADDSLWKCVFYQNNYKTDTDFSADTSDIGGGTENNFINASKDNAKKSFSSSNTRLYSILDGGITPYKNQNSNCYEFLLTYNCAENESFDITHGVYNRWQQTNDPTKEYEYPTTLGEAIADGYTSKVLGLSGNANQNYWGGLVISSSDACYLDGSVGHSDCYYAVGTVNNWGKRGTPVSEYDATYEGGYKKFNSASQTLLFVRAK